MSRINYDSATVNISVFIQQRKISFQNGNSLKTMRLEVLLCEEIKKIVRFTVESWAWIRRAIADLFVMFISWTSQKALRVHEFCLQVSHDANLKHSKSTWRQLTILWKLQDHNIKSSGHNTRSALLYRGDFQERLINNNYCYYIGNSRVSRLIKEVSTLYPSDKFAYHSAHNNSFLTLYVIHELKKTVLFYIIV